MQVLRLRDVVARTGRSRSMIYAEIKAGTFPQQFPLGVRAVGWLSDEIDKWIAEHARQRQDPAAAPRAVPYAKKHDAPPARNDRAKRRRRRVSRGASR